MVHLRSGKTCPCLTCGATVCRSNCYGSRLRRLSQLSTSTLNPLAPASNQPRLAGLDTSVCGRVVVRARGLLADMHIVASLHLAALACCLVAGPP